jgi:hypothetical protein
LVYPTPLLSITLLSNFMRILTTSQIRVYPIPLAHSRLPSFGLENIHIFLLLDCTFRSSCKQFTLNYNILRSSCKQFTLNYNILDSLKFLYSALLENIHSNYILYGMRPTLLIEYMFFSLKLTISSQIMPQ